MLDRGQIIERGKHDELLALGGKYARLCEQSLLETRPQSLAEDEPEIAESTVLTPDERLSI